MLQVAIVDDSDDIRLLWRRLLEVSPEFEVCADASNGEAAVEIARRLRPDVMLLDLSMPDTGGLAALPRILAESPATAVVVLSGFGKRSFAERAFASGARGYLEKHLPASTLCDRLLAVLQDGPDAVAARPTGLASDTGGI